MKLYLNYKSTALSKSFLYQTPNGELLLKPIKGSSGMLAEATLATKTRMKTTTDCLLAKDVIPSFNSNLYFQF